VVRHGEAATAAGFARRRGSQTRWELEDTYTLPRKGVRQLLKALDCDVPGQLRASPNRPRNRHRRVWTKIARRISARLGAWDSGQDERRSDSSKGQGPARKGRRAHVDVAIGASTARSVCSSSLPNAAYSAHRASSSSKSCTTYSPSTQRIGG